MKGPFSLWAFFGLTIMIDLATHVYHPKKYHRINPYDPIREVSLIIPAHKEPVEYIEKTILSIQTENYPLKSIIICGDSESKGAEKLDEHIEQKIIKDKLTLSESGCRIIHKRGYALGLISIDDINKEIDSFAKL